LIDWDKSRFFGSIRRNVQNNTQFEDYLVLQEIGITLNIYKKVTDALDSNAIPITGRKSFAQIRGAYTNSEGFNLAEGQVGGHDQNFQYINPIIFS